MEKYVEYALESDHVISEETDVGVFYIDYTVYYSLLLFCGLTSFCFVLFASLNVNVVCLFHQLIVLKMCAGKNEFRESHTKHRILNTI